MTKKGYWIAMVDIADYETYQKYIDANGVAFEKFGAKFIVRGGQHTEPEGETGDRHVVLEFDSYETALACYRSEEYREALKYRLDSSRAKFVIVEGV